MSEKIYGSVLVKCKHAIHTDVDSYCMGIPSKWSGNSFCVLSNSNMYYDNDMCPRMFVVDWIYYLKNKQHLNKVKYL